MNSPYNSFFNNNGPNMPISAHVRFFNDVSGVPAVDLFVDGAESLNNIEYGAFTEYTSVPPGIYEIAIYEPGRRDSPLEQATESFTVGSSFTLVATGEPGNVMLYQIPEPYSSPAPGLRSYLRLVNLSEETAPLDVTLQNGVQIFNDVKYTELTNYRRLVPNIYTLTVKSSADGETLIVVPNLQLNAGKIYSVYIIRNGMGDNSLRAEFTVDSEYSS